MVLLSTTRINLFPSLPTCILSPNLAMVRCPGQIWGELMTPGVAGLRIVCSWVDYLGDE